MTPEKVEKRVKEVAEEAQQAFWAVVAEKFPEAEGGDFPPDATFQFDIDCETAVRRWVTWNCHFDDVTD